MKRKRKQREDMIDPAELQGYDDWLVKHLDEMVRKYPGKVIAVYAGKLVAVGDSYKEVYAAAKAQGIPVNPFVMEVPRAEDFASVPSAFAVRQID